MNAPNQQPGSIDYWPFPAFAPYVAPPFTKYGKVNSIAAGRNGPPAVNLYERGSLYESSIKLPGQYVTTRLSEKPGYITRSLRLAPLFFFL